VTPKHALYIRKMIILSGLQHLEHTVDTLSFRLFDAWRNMYVKEIYKQLGTRAKHGRVEEKADWLWKPIVQGNSKERNVVEKLHAQSRRSEA